MNSRRSLWHILGTEPTGDERAIKRAYAKRLKVTRPEDDPQAFQELRDAYEYALHHAPRFAEELAQSHEEFEVAAPVAVPEPVVEMPLEAQVETKLESPPAELWGIVENTIPAPPAELWGVIDTPPPPPPELWGVIEIDPAEEAASIWQACLDQLQQLGAEPALAHTLQDPALLRLDVREEFELCALRYCASENYNIDLRDAVFAALGWNGDFSYLARSHGELVRSAVQRYRADQSFMHFIDFGENYPGLDVIMSQKPPSAYARQLSDQKFTRQLRELLYTIRWHHGEMLACKLDIAQFERWEHAVFSKRYFRQTALHSAALGFALHFMLAGVVSVAGMELDNVGSKVSLFGCQALAFALLAMLALRWPAALFDQLQGFKERTDERLPALQSRPGLLQLGWIIPFMFVSLLLFAPGPAPTLRVATASALCVLALLAYAANRSLLQGLFGYAVGLSLFASIFMSGKGQSALAIGDSMMLVFCLLVLALRTANGLYGQCGWPEAMLPRLRATWVTGAAIGLAALALQPAVATVLGAMLFAWACVGMLFAPADLRWKFSWPLVLAPAIASFLLAGQVSGTQTHTMIKLGAVLALAVLYFTMLHLYRLHRLSRTQNGLS
ncbi:J domain-containing protein [Janthinobacterium psychrotolerans]|uniref:J domain-containing protein n=1 Tax=Janthinobacterium psychrotolerans TaxID=1747903 RepID=A0A1A7BVA9_9BURK|nr:J domain-containing protein [Janthinobacterium psychrotolerans]OBV37437.1 hypothetical protein ASR47_100397 [Janthinobacterium psychrotolerans]